MRDLAVVVPPYIILDGFMFSPYPGIASVMQEGTFSF